MDLMERFVEALFEDDLPARVVVVEIFPLVRRAIVQILHGSEGLTVIGEAKDSHGVAEMAVRGRADMVVMDAYLGAEREGLELCRRLKDLADPPVVVVYTADNSAQAVADCVVAGADSFVHKSAEPEILVDAVERSRRRKRSWLLGHVVTPSALSLDQAGLLTLTPRERQILTLLLLRRTNQEIAGELHLARQTVKNHVCNLLHKLGMRNRRELYENAVGGRALRPVPGAR